MNHGTHFFSATPGRHRENITLVPGIDGTTLNATCYNCRKTGNLTYNFSEAGRTGIYYLQCIHSFSQNQIKKMIQSTTIGLYWTHVH